MKPQTFSVLVAAAVLGGCASLLPSGTSSTASPFSSYAQAEAAAARITPFVTQEDQLAALGFDPAAGANVTLIPYPDVIARLAPHPAVPLSALDAGVRRCIEAQAACHAWLFHFDHQQRRREGGFWLDFFNLRRVTAHSGWWFDALVVVADGKVLFRSTGGQAHVERTDRQTNPLGPFQPAGESAGRSLLH